MEGLHVNININFSGKLGGLSIAWIKFIQVAAEWEPIPLLYAPNWEIGWLAVMGKSNKIS